MPDGAGALGGTVKLGDAAEPGEGWRTGEPDSAFKLSGAAGSGDAHRVDQQGDREPRGLGRPNRFRLLREDRTGLRRCSR
nr:hypothetical protein [Microbispora rosea]